MDDELSHFIMAPKRSIDNSLKELKAGKKQTHWMWFIFPQIQGLSKYPSETSKRYELKSLVHAVAFLNDKILGPQIRARTKAVLCHSDKTAKEIFGNIDSLKFHASMTLFAQASDDGSDFHKALSIFFDGSPEPITIRALSTLDIRR